MFARIGYKAVELTTKTFNAAIKPSSTTLPQTQNVITDAIQLVSQRVKNLKLYNSNETRNHLFNFTKNGEINITQRIYGSDDLKFLEHIKNKHYVQPKIYFEGTLPCTKQGINQSNKFAKDFISENEHFVDGYRYCGPSACFDDFGRNISRFRNGTQEIVILDKTLDNTLIKTINAFKNRINNKNLNEEQKINELMKFVDEVFSTSKSGEITSKYVGNMMKKEQCEVLLGDIINSGAGVCRHRAILTKTLADGIGLKCKVIHGYYNGGGHAWNEIITKEDTYLFDAMHGNLFNIGNTSRNLVPEVFPYRITNPEDKNRLIAKYFDINSTIGMLYRLMKHKRIITTSEAILTPTTSGYHIKPLTDNVFINGEKIISAKELSIGDFVNLKDIGFQII